MIYKPVTNITTKDELILFDTNKEYKFENRITKDETGCIRGFTEKEMIKMFIQVEEAAPIGD